MAMMVRMTMNPRTRSTNTTNNNKRPAVVLVGWLGCRPRHLRRYSQMYDSIGWGSLVRIGSPKSVIAAMTEGPCADSDSDDQSTTTTTTATTQSSEMKHLAIHTLRELHNNQTPYFIFHVFSNNGCFFWEWIRFLLFGQQHSSLLSDDDDDDDDESSIMIDLRNLRQKLVGVIFDSAPAYYDGDAKIVRSAFRYVVSPTKNNEQNNHPLEITNSLNANVVKQRFRDFWSGLCQDPSNIPQLYVYSQCDKLAPADQLEELIECREEILGEGNVWRHLFLDSEHCSHLLKYPNEYDGLVRQFLSFCMSQIGGMCDDYENDFPVRARL
mmetsp:Transcript_26593/g.41980  ORF Transcript_26593/g.41980 Transcript_26593/m.41980 type:complete len:325 (+) Transcript_26593:271-1245(+)